MNDYVPFADDTPSSVYCELKEFERLIMQAAQDCCEKGKTHTTLQSSYDNCKEQELIRLFAQEAASVTTDEKGKQVQTLKRVEAERSAIYRTKYGTERLAAVLAKREYEVAQSYLESLKAVLMSIQTRSRMIKQDYDLS